MAEEPRPPLSDPLPGQPAPSAGRASGAGDAASWHRMAGIGVEFIVSVGVFAALGWWLDSKSGTSPWGLIAGCGLGFVGGLWNMVRAANRMMR